MAALTESEITIKISLDENQVPEKITWKTDEEGAVENDCKATMLTFWDEKESNTLRIDLWTKEMMIEEMKHFCSQTLMTLADTFERSTNEGQLANEMRAFGKEFADKMGLLKSN